MLESLRQEMDLAKKQMKRLIEKVNEEEAKEGQDLVTQSTQLL